MKNNFITFLLFVSSFQSFPQSADGFYDLNFTNIYSSLFDIEIFKLDNIFILHENNIVVNTTYYKKDFSEYSNNFFINIRNKNITINHIYLYLRKISTFTKVIDRGVFRKQKYREIQASFRF